MLASIVEMGITSTTPSYRIEAEDSRVVKSYNSRPTHSSDSGGASQFLTATSHYVEYTFVGTGIDILHRTNTSTGLYRVQIDGKEVGRVDTNGYTAYQQDFSVRNLEEGTHTVRVTYISGSYVYIDAFNIYK